MPRLRVELFGGFRLIGEGDCEIHLPSRKARALFAYLALYPDRSHTRSKLADLLWGEHGERHARQNLRKCLSNMRKALGGAGRDVVSAKGDIIGLTPDRIEVDALEFQRCIAGKRLQAAIPIFTGALLLDGLDISSEAFEHWLARERARLNELGINALHQFAEQRSRDGETDEAIELARRVVAIDPLCEEGHRLLMRLYRKVGRRSDAVRQYRICATLLSAELGVAPSADTMEEFQVIMDRQATPAVTSARPAIAVLSFQYPGGDALSEILARGVTEEVVAELSRFRWFSTFPYTLALRSMIGVPEACHIAKALRASYLVDGSIRCVTGRVRAVVRFLDGESGECIWAERIEHPADDMLNLQSAIAETIAARLLPEMSEFESRRSLGHSLPDPSPWQLWQRGLAQFYRYTGESVADARRLFRRSVEIDPGYAPAYASLALADEHEALFLCRETAQPALDRGFEMAHRAVRLGPRDAFAHYALGRMFIRRKEIESAVVEMETAIKLNPSFALAQHGHGIAMYYDGRAQEAVQQHYQAARLSPVDQESWAFYHMRARGHFDLRQYEDAAIWATRAVRQPNAKTIANATLAAALSKIGRTDDARKMIGSLIRREPTLTTGYVIANFGNSRISHQLEHFAETLRKAGLPD